MSNLRSWAYQRHIPNEHINQLREFIQFELTNPISRFGHSRITTSNSYKATLVCSNSHRAELKDSEVYIMTPYTNLTVKHRPLTIKLNPYGQD